MDLDQRILPHDGRGVPKELNSRPCLRIDGRGVDILGVESQGFQFRAGSPGLVTHGTVHLSKELELLDEDVSRLVPFLLGCLDRIQPVAHMVGPLFDRNRSLPQGGEGIRPKRNDNPQSGPFGLDSDVASTQGVTPRTGALAFES
jgi:hypothetical protein